MKLNRMHVVLSACLPEAGNKTRTDEMESRLIHEGYAYDKAEGCYKGAVEDSFVVQVTSFPDVLELMRMSQDFQQESVLLVDARNKAYVLYNHTSRMDYLGALTESNWKPTTEHVDAYTKVGDVYYYTYNFNKEM